MKKEVSRRVECQVGGLSYVLGIHARWIACDRHGCSIKVRIVAQLTPCACSTHRTSNYIDAVYIGFTIANVTAEQFIDYSAQLARPTSTQRTLRNDECSRNIAVVQVFVYNANGNFI